MSDPVDKYEKAKQQLKCSLFISNLSEKTTEAELISFFKDYQNSILLAQIEKNMGALNFSIQKGNRGIIIFSSHEVANEAKINLNMKKLFGRTVYITWHERNSSLRRNNTSNLFVKNIPLTISPREFFEYFLQFGEILSARLGEDDEGNSRGYGYVSYVDQNTVNKVLNEVDEKIVWGAKLKVAKFQKKNERMHFQKNTNMKNTLYIKNIPNQYKEEEMKKIFEMYGKIIWFKMSCDKNNRKFAFITFENDVSAAKAREKLNGFKWDGNSKVENSECLFVDYLQKKNVRDKIIQAKIAESNLKINNQYRNCNLHIRNIPVTFDQQKLHDLFSKFGEIKSVKIPNYILITKIGKEFKEISLSKLFGYVCFQNQESAIKAMKEMNGSYIEGEKNMKRPLLIELFMPKMERREMILRVHNAMVMRGNINNNIMYNPYLQNCFGGYPLRMQPMKPNKKKKVDGKASKTDELNQVYLSSLQNQEEQKDYLGELIFKQIQNHPIAEEKKLDINLIAKITGMILGIENFKEIVEITKNNKLLTDRINEAINLIRENQKI